MTLAADPARQGIDLCDLEMFRHGPPHHLYGRLREDAPVFWHEPTRNTPQGEGFWCLTRHADVTWAAKAPELFSSCTGGQREGGGTLIEDLPLGLAAGVLMNMQDDPRHRELRKLVSPALSFRQLRQIESELARRCDALLDQALLSSGPSGSEPTEFVTAVAAELPLQAIASLLGVPQSDRGFLFEWAEATLDYEDHDLGQVSERMQRANEEMSAYCADLLADKRRNPGGDITTQFVTGDLPASACPGGHPTDLEQTLFFHLLVAAGSETTRNSITAGVLAAAEDPSWWGRLRADRSLLPGAVEEILRWASSTIYNRRTATQDLELHGQTIRAGDKVVLWWQAANFDPAVFSNPLEFDVHRHPNPHLAFGAGNHFCLGANLARLEMRLVLNGMLDRWSHIELAGPPVRSRSNKHAGFRQLPVLLWP